MTEEKAALIAAIWLAAASLILFTVMGIDKLKARHGMWRVPERTLFLLALLGGGIGGMLGMRVFRHKTKHTSFRVGFPLLALLNVAVAAAVVIYAAAV